MQKNTCAFSVNATLAIIGCLGVFGVGEGLASPAVPRPAQAARSATSLPFGLTHTPLGKARIEMSGKGLEVTGIGHSGGDGVAIHLRGSGGWRGRFTPVDLSKVGTAMVGTLIGTTGLPGVPGSVLAVDRMVRTATGLDVSVDFSGIGSPSTQVELTDIHGARIASFTVANGTPLVIPGSGYCEKSYRCEDPPVLVSQTGDCGGSGSATVIAPGEVFTNVAFMSFTAIGQTSSFVNALTDLRFEAAGIDSFRIESEAIQFEPYGPFTAAVGGATLDAFGGRLSVSDLAGGGGVAVELGRAESVDLTWDPLDPSATAPIGAELRVTSAGAFECRENRQVGVLRVTKTGSSEYTVNADFSAIGSPTQRLQVLNGGYVIADIPGHSGVVATAEEWPQGFGKLGQATPCKKGTWWPPTELRIDGVSYLADELRVLSEGAGEINFLSEFVVEVSGFDRIPAIGDRITRLDESLYGVNAVGQLVRINLNTFAETTIGNIGFSGVRGLAYDDATMTLYGITRDGELLRIDRATGAGELLQIVVSASATPIFTSLALDRDGSSTRLFTTDISTPRALYRIDLASSPPFAVTQVGLTGAFPQILGLAVHPRTGVLFGSDRSPDHLVTIDKATGAVTHPYAATSGISNIQSLGFDPERGTLYGNFDSGVLATFDLQTGQATAVSSTSLTGASAANGLTIIARGRPSAMVSNLRRRVEALVDEGALKAHDGKRLSTALDAALRDLGRGRQDHASQEVDNFIIETERLIGKGKLAPAAGGPLIDVAGSILAELGC